MKTQNVTTPKLKKKPSENSFNEKIIFIFDTYNISYKPDDLMNILNDFKELFTNYKTPKTSTKHWDSLVRVYFDTYASLNEGVFPTFTPTEAKGLKMIINVLKKRFISMGNNESDWTESEAVKRLSSLFNYAISIDYIRNGFSSAYIYNNLDKVISQIHNKLRTQNNNENSILGIK